MVPDGGGVPIGPPPDPHLHLPSLPGPRALERGQRPLIVPAEPRVTLATVPRSLPPGQELDCPHLVPPHPWDPPQELLWVPTTGGQLINERLGINE